jgi:hypothetical protein
MREVLGPYGALVCGLIAYARESQGEVPGEWIGIRNIEACLDDGKVVI